MLGSGARCGRSCCLGKRLRGTVMAMTVEQEVLAAAESRAEALAAGDAEQLTDLLHEAFRWTAHVGDTYDRTEYIRRNTEGHTVWRSQTLINPEVVVVSETAVLYAEVHDVVRSEGDASEAFRMPMTQVWVRSGSSWKCLAGHALASLRHMNCTRCRCWRALTPIG